MWLMLQQDKPDDFVIATGHAHSAREFVEEAFKCVGRKIVWEGKGVEEVGKDLETGVVRVKVNPKFFRPTEVVSWFFDAGFVRFSNFNFNSNKILIGLPVGGSIQG